MKRNDNYDISFQTAETAACPVFFESDIEVSLTIREYTAIVFYVIFSLLTGKKLC
jgi:hypothetical protein